MPYRFPYSWLNENLGTTTADGFRNVANQAANFACNLYQNYADATVGFPDPTGFASALHGFYSSLCAPRNKLPPNPPSIPFVGGQCEGLPYNVTIFVERIPPNPLTYSVYFPSVPGPLTGTGLFTYPSGAHALGVFAPNYPTGVLSAASSGAEGARTLTERYKILSVSVQPVGHSDNCGNPNPQYRDNPAPPPSAFFDNDNILNLGAGINIKAPIRIIPTLNVGGFEFKPEVQVQVGPFDVTFAPDGISIEINRKPNKDRIHPNPNILPPGLPPARPPKNDGVGGISVGIGNISASISNVSNNIVALSSSISDLQEKLDEMEDCVCPVSYEKTSSSLGQGRSGTASLPSHCIQVKLQLTQIPSNAKVQSGGPGHPEYYFCGYVEFGDGGSFGERIPVSVVDSIFTVPPWASSFGWSLYQGYDCVVTAIALSPSEANSELAYLQMKKKPS